MVELMDLSMYLSMYIAAISAILLIALVVTYLRIYRDTHAEFSLGLTMFALILFAQNILTVYSYVTMSHLIADPLPAYLLGINVAEVASILVLFRTTLR